MDAHPPEAEREDKPRDAYQPPRIQGIGSIEELTLGASLGRADGSGFIPNTSPT